MAVAARVDPKDFFSAEEWAPISAHSSWKGLALVAHCWATIAAVSALVIVWPNPLTIAAALVIVGCRQLGLAILMHDAAHRALHKDPRVNDFVGEWLCGAPVGARVDSYRRYHLQHHKFAQQAEDPDLGLSAPFPITGPSLWRKVVRDLTGQTFFKQRTAVLRAKWKARKANGETVIEVIAGEIVRQERFLLWNLALFAVFAGVGAWWAYFVCWLAPMATWYPMVTRFRNIAEHALIAKDEPDPLRHARTTRASWWERLAIAPYYVNYHCEHHMFMHVPCWNLPKAHRALERKGVLAGMETAPGYASVLRLAAAA